MVKSDRPLQKFGGLKLLGTGRALPKRAVSSAELDQLHDFETGYLHSVTGVETRYVCDAEDQIELGKQAAVKALSAAGLRPQDLDMIICASAVPYQPIPATAPAIQRALGIDDGTCFATDVNSTCLSFPVALQFASGLLQGGLYNNILIVSSEIASRALPWNEAPAVAGLFGDGAGAAVVCRDDKAGIVASSFTTLSSGFDACGLASGGTRFDFHKEFELFSKHSLFMMDGKELFRLTARDFGAFVDKLLAAADTSRNEIDCVIAHQASPGALAHMTRLCGFTQEQVIDISATVGNQVAASIPFVLDYAFEHGLVREGNRVLILGTSAGVSFGGLVMDL